MPLAPAVKRDPELPANGGLLHGLRQGIELGDRLPVEHQDVIPRPKTRVGGRSSRGHTRDNESRRATPRVGTVQGVRAEHQAKIPPPNPAELGQLGRDPTSPLCRDGEAEPARPALRSVDAHDLTIEIDQRPPSIDVVHDGVGPNRVIRGSIRSRRILGH